MKFRDEAREALVRAKNELKRNPVYSALELRFCIESIVYGLLNLFREEMSENDYETWQPRKLLKFLEELDPSVTLSSEWSIGKQNEKGELPLNLTLLGEDKKLTLKQVKKYYDKLGSFLHTPTFKQLKEGNVKSKAEKIHVCNELIQILELILSSPVYHSRSQIRSQIECLACKQSISRNIYGRTETFTVLCPNDSCKAEYSVRPTGNNDVSWEPILQLLSCGTESCEHKINIFKNCIEEGASWKCNGCGKMNILKLGVFTI